MEKGFNDVNNGLNEFNDFKLLTWNIKSFKMSLVIFV